MEGRMPASVLSAFFVFTFITAITPGPNNILALTTGSRAGVRGSIPVLAGICGGFLAVMAICGVLSFSFSVLSASFLQVMRYVGSAYLLWLAWKTAMPKAGDSHGGHAGAGFLTGFVLQFVNVKIMVYGMTAYSAFILPYHDSVAALFAGMFFLTMMGSLGTVVWAVAGARLQGLFRRHARMTNWLLGAMLVGCALSLLDQ
ncbi:translocator protein, LysE family [Desulfovibrio piger ATCC 29098]|uniref:Translocator protein, LysE family n=2 Tax=Desulfovibrio piger TaxID=901 RepID=B6WS46_9BACT|nr:translocator protein, LysE family [Desulfovibrio piger ATCC 29098]